MASRLLRALACIGAGAGDPLMMGSGTTPSDGACSSRCCCCCSAASCHAWLTASCDECRCGRDGSPACTWQPHTTRQPLASRYEARKRSGSVQFSIHPLMTEHLVSVQSNYLRRLCRPGSHGIRCNWQLLGLLQPRLRGVNQLHVPLIDGAAGMTQLSRQISHAIRMLEAY